MEFEKAKNSKRNIVFGAFEKLLILLLPFALRTVMIQEMGADYLGLNGLFASVLTVLSIAELGFSDAIVYSMYKPVSEGDTSLINAFLNLYKKIYRIIGFVILAVGFILVPFIPRLINGDVPDDINVYTLYLIYLGNTVLSYFCFAYYRTLISVFQRNDLISKITVAITSFQYLSQIALIFIFHNYYIFAIVIPIATILSNITIFCLARKFFPDYHCEGKVPKSVKDDISKNMNGLIVAKIGGVSRNAFDSIFISMFLGLAEVAMYNNYYYILNAITSFMLLVISSINASVGNSVASESVEKNYADLTKINFLYMWIAGWCSTCLLCLYQPFMKIWVGEELMFPMLSVILFCVYFYSLKLGDVQSSYMIAAGLFYEFRTCAIVQAIMNIILNYVLGKFFGVNGIIVATVCSILFVDFVFGNRVVFKYYFKNGKEGQYYKLHLLYFVVSLAICGLTYVACYRLGFILRMVVCVFVPNILYILIYHRSKNYKDAIPWILSVFKLNNKKLIQKVLMI